ncbi:MAG: hypothetical protein ACRD0Y_09285 [Terriglobales bacterium]
MTDPTPPNYTPAGLAAAPPGASAADMYVLIGTAEHKRRILRIM